MLIMNNYGTGFAGFQTCIDIVTEGMGGAPYTRRAVASVFKQFLTWEMDKKPRVDFRAPDWTETTDEAFDAACLKGMAYFERNDPAPVLATAIWNGLQLQLRADDCSLHGTIYGMGVGLVGAPTSTYDSRKRTSILKWSPGLIDTGCLVVHGSEYSRDGNKSVSVQSAEAATTALRKLVERHFKVTFEDVA
ncbi:hypothetical protein CcrColossus_gp249 [Caulobacter phage CcrColossus]|uniref:Uncharacterized protein n=1 Tax=Caulobacter phage CcrColossus TaxID=1211640 RepID=K4JRZ6_9CAUD|nr:hypothetical protein CcrColossus_gp249 [Caulobacter phage CcrColossus]AFU88119.1 hypothetical protein CcrColossus_gp249 [Caulobacter phage CcrColossus]